MTMKQLDYGKILAQPRDEWPDKTCTECGAKWKTPRGGEGICSDCQEKADRAEAERQRQWAEAEARKKLEARAAYLRENLTTEMTAAGVPGGYLRYTRDGWEKLYGKWRDRQSTAELIGWPWNDLHPTDWLVLFYGPYGQRKTSMATSLMADAILRDLWCVWWDMTDYVERLKLGIRREQAEKDFSAGRVSRFPRELEGVKTYSEIKTAALDCDVLLIDDLGSVKGARGGESWWKEEVTYLLRHRHAWNRATLATTNGRIQDLAAIDPSLVSRMQVRLAFEMDDGNDYRRAEAKQPPNRPRRTAGRRDQ